MRQLTHYMFACSLIILGGCSDWLNVKPSNQVEQSEMFSTETGFKNALTGIYIQLKSQSLYGKNLTMGFMENLSQHWKVSSGSMEGHTSAYNYKDKEVEAVVDEIYTQLYHTIVNINNLLGFIDNGVLTPSMYRVIKGEALALRAFCHLDLLRLYGPIPGRQDANKMLSYAQSASRKNLPVHTWDEFIGLLEQDLLEAEKLLKEIDTVIQSPQDDFLTYRQNRMNYWAILALKARFYLWIQKKDQAMACAKQVISACPWKLSTSQDFTQKNYIASKEHLFALHVYDLEELTEHYFYRPGGVEQTQKRIQKDLFQSDITDIRVKELWKPFADPSRTRYVLMKYKQGAESSIASQQLIPLIRLYEMYLIAIECSRQHTEYQQLTNKIVEARNISLTIDLSSIDKKDEFVAKEYNKEFYGEGQHFLQCKRRGDENILWSNKQGSSSIYMLPIPKNEIKYIQ